MKSHTIYQSASVGIALGAEKYTDPGQVLRDADLAMYRVKEVKDREVVIFDDHMHASLAARLRLETDLQRALERQELLIHYQPIVSLDTRQVLSFDALVRWQHPTHGLLPPESFIRMAEETGLINELSWWIIEQAACQTARWQRLFPSTPALAIAVNVTGNLFKNIKVAERFLNLLNMNSVAEGVERPEQVRFLREMNCPQTQGF